MLGASGRDTLKQTTLRVVIVRTLQVEGMAKFRHAGKHVSEGLIFKIKFLQNKNVSKNSVKSKIDSTAFSLSPTRRTSPLHCVYMTEKIPFPALL